MSLCMDPVADCRGWKTRAWGMNLDFGYFLSDQHCVSGFLPPPQGNLGDVPEISPAQGPALSQLQDLV